MVDIPNMTKLLFMLAKQAETKLEGHELVSFTRLPIRVTETSLPKVDINWDQWAQYAEEPR